MSSLIPPEITTLMASSTLISVRVTSDAGTITKNPDDGMGVEDAMRVVMSGGIRLDAVFKRYGFQVPGKTRSNQ